MSEHPQETLPGLEVQHERELQPCGRFEWERIVRRVTSEPWQRKLVAFVLATYADPDGTRVMPGTDLLSDVCGMSGRSVKRHVARLVEIGLLDVVRRGGGRSGGVTEYRLTVPSDLLETVTLLPVERRRRHDKTRREMEATQVAPVPDDTPRNGGHPGGPSSTTCTPETEATQVAPVPETGAIENAVTCGNAAHHPPANNTTQVRDKVSTSPARPSPARRSRFDVDGVPPPCGWRPPRRPPQPTTDAREAS